MTWAGIRRAWSRFGVDPRDAAAVERHLALARVLLALLSLAALLAEHGRRAPAAGAAALAAFSVHSILLVVYTRQSRRRDAPPRVLLHHLLDLAWVTLVFCTNGGVGGPFIGFYLFVLLGAGFRWGQPETVATGAAAMLTLAADAGLRTALGQVVDWHVAGIDLVYLVVGTLLVSLGENERRHREQAWAAGEILTQITPHSGLVPSVQNVLGTLMRQVRASRAVLVVSEDGHERVFLWQATAGDAGAPPQIRLRQHTRANCGTWLFPVPAEADAWQARIRRRDGRREAQVTTLDASGEPSGIRVELCPLLDAPFEWREVLCLSSLPGEGWHGRLFLFDPGIWRPGYYDLRFVQAVVRQIVPTLLNLQLHRRLGSRSGALDRANIALRLHDGVIQSLIGIEMQVDVMRRQAGTPRGAADDLEDIQRVLADEILNLRDLMQVLKPDEVEPEHLVEHLIGELAHFRNRTGIDAILACVEDTVDFAPRVCREVTAIVREALANVRKHSGATAVRVHLGQEGADWLLSVDDNGRGFGFEGTLDGAELDARHLAPAIINERVRAIGGRLTVSSRPGHGARLDIRIPGRHHA